jgi:glycosyltransferase involved in cell wall biosynthesis
VRLCYLANPNSIHTQRWLRYFAQQGHEIHLIGDYDLQRPLDPGIIVHRPAVSLKIHKVRVLALGYAVRRLVREIQPDVLHAHQTSPHGWLGAMSGYHPFIVTAWGSDLLIKPHRSWLYRLLTRWTLRRADYVTCVSKDLARAARTLGADPSRLEVAPWGIDTAVFHPALPSVEFRTRLGLGLGPVVLSMRSMGPLYNPLDVARSIPRVLAQVPKAQFIIRTYHYAPDLLTQFRAIVKEHDATEAVHYVADLPDDRAIADLYRLADVAVSVPSSDGTPLSVLEALGCGVALVLSDVPSLHEWVRDQQEGMFVPVGDVQAISAAIVRLLTDEALRRRLQTAGVTLVQQRADRRVWMARAGKVYERLINRQDSLG